MVLENYVEVMVMGKIIGIIGRCFYLEFPIRGLGMLQSGIRVVFLTLSLHGPINIAHK
jgi:hypothetical protein